MARQVFYSFYYKEDAWRTSTVRNIGTIEGSKPAPDNDWESVKKDGDPAIQRWIDDQMHYRSCTVVLIGSNTAGRKWIEYEIRKSWENKMGVVGVCIHKLKDSNQQQSNKGRDPFNLSVNGLYLPNVVKTYDPPYSDSKDVYNHIASNISNWVEEAVNIRKKYS